MLTPAVWSGLSVQGASAGMAASLPVAGPAGSDRAGFGGMPGGMPGGSARAADGRRDFANGENPFGRAFRDGETPFGGAQGQEGGAPPAFAGTPPTAGRGGNPGDRMGGVDSRLLQWLVANRGNAEYIVAVSSANEASSIILQTGLPVMATGGFSGSDPILTADSLAQLVAEGKVRYFLLGGGPGGFGRDGAGFSVASWVEQHGTLVPASIWGGTSSGAQLYDLGAGK